MFGFVVLVLMLVLVFPCSCSFLEMVRNHIRRINVYYVYFLTSFPAACAVLGYAGCYFPMLHLITNDCNYVYAQFCHKFSDGIRREHAYN